jgi:hypothetical protein
MAANRPERRRSRRSGRPAQRPFQEGFPIPDDIPPAPTEPTSHDAPAPAEPAPGATVSTNPQWRLTTTEIVGCFVAFALWIILIAAGVAIDTPGYLTLLETPGKTGTAGTAASAFVVLICHVVPNVALLSCLSAYLGVIGSRTLPKEKAEDQPAVDHRATYAIAVTRGFYVYLIIMSGSLLTSSGGFGEWADPAKPGTSYETYTRLAGMTSLISFTAGFNPNLFRHLLSRFGGGPADPAHPSTPETPASPPAK